MTGKVGARYFLHSYGILSRKNTKEDSEIEVSDWLMIGCKQSRWLVHNEMCSCYVMWLRFEVCLTYHTANRTFQVRMNVGHTNVISLITIQEIVHICIFLKKNTRYSYSEFYAVFLTWLVNYLFRFFCILNFFMQGSFICQSAWLIFRWPCQKLHKISNYQYF